jgi:hypothetical protein
MRSKYSTKPATYQKKRISRHRIEHTAFYMRKITCTFFSFFRVIVMLTRVYHLQRKPYQVHVCKTKHLFRVYFRML